MDLVALRKVGIFSGLDDSDLQAIAEIVIPRHYTKGQLIVLAEEEGSSFFIIGRGEVKVSVMSEDGREVILSILREGEFFGEMAVLNGKPRSATVTATEDSDILLIRRPDFLRLLQEIPQISIKFLQELAGRLRKADRMIESLALMDVPVRIMRTLLQLADEIGIDTEVGIVIRNRPTHQQLSEMAGTTRETVSRVLKKLERLGYIRSGRNITGSNMKEIVILKPDEMREMIL